MKRSKQLYAWVLAALLPAAAAHGWLGKGHQNAVGLAVEALEGQELPAFFVAGSEAIAHFSLDPDNFTRPIVSGPLHDAEAPEHYFDLELVSDVQLPASRYEFLELIISNGRKPSKVGLLPYAVAEWTQRLTVAFAEHRKWPDDPHIRQKCLVYAGILAHYAQDLCQPLHTTIHYDGRAKADGSSPRSGIHLKVDALLGKVSLPDARARQIKAELLEKVLPAVLEQLRRSHALVDTAYELEAQLPAADKPVAAGSQVERFAQERLAESGRFTAALYLTAWRDSAGIVLPQWLRREQPAPTSAPLPARSASPSPAPSASGERAATGRERGIDD